MQDEEFPSLPLRCLCGVFWFCFFLFLLFSVKRLTSLTALETGVLQPHEQTQHEYWLSWVLAVSAHPCVSGWILNQLLPGWFCWTAVPWWQLSPISDLKYQVSRMMCSVIRMELSFPYSLLEKLQVHSWHAAQVCSAWCTCSALEQFCRHLQPLSAKARNLSLPACGVADPRYLWVGSLPEIAKPFWVSDRMPCTDVVQGCALI